MSHCVFPTAPLALSQISAFEYAAVEPSLHVIPARTKGLLVVLVAGHAECAYVAVYEAKRCNHALEDFTRPFQKMAGSSTVWKADRSFRLKLEVGAVNTKHCVGVHAAQNDIASHCSSVHCAWHCGRDLPKVFVPSPYTILPAWSSWKHTVLLVLVVVLVVVVVAVLVVGRVVVSKHDWQRTGHAVDTIANEHSEASNTVPHKVLSATPLHNLGMYCVTVVVVVVVVVVVAVLVVGCVVVSKHDWQRTGHAVDTIANEHSVASTTVPHKVLSATPLHNLGMYCVAVAAVVVLVVVVMVVVVVVVVVVIVKHVPSPCWQSGKSTLVGHTP